MKTKKMMLQMFVKNTNIKNQLSEEQMKKLIGGDGGGGSTIDPTPPVIYIKE